MFGNPFSKFPSAVQFPNEKCRWCLQRIGMGGGYPIPVCDPCFMMAYNNASEPGPKQAMWPRMMSEFNDEAKAWIKKMSSTPTSLDLMEASSEAGGDVAELRKHIDQLRLGNDKQLADAMEERLKERLAELARFKKNMPSIISDLGKVS